MEVPLQNLIQKLQSKELDAAIIPSWDEWENEMVEDRYNRLKFISNFSGSNGLAIVDARGKKSAFFTDGRYMLQAHKEVPSKHFEVILFEGKAIARCLSNYENGRVGFDPYIARYSYLLYLLGLYPSLEFIPVKNLIPSNKPKIKSYMEPARKTERIPDDEAGTSFLEKKEIMFEALNDIKPNWYDYVLLTSPDIISWILNLRVIDKISMKNSSSLAINAYMLLNRKGKDIIYLESTHVFPRGISLSIKKLEDAISDFKKLEHQKLYVTRNTPYIFAEILTDYLQKEDVLAYKQCIKNQAEYENIADVHKVDGAMLTEFLSDLLRSDKIEKLDEFQLSQMLTDARKKSKSFICNSFPPIVGSGTNSAIIHYRPSPGDAKKISVDELLLIDSGGHYRWGTTDVTRTIKLGAPSEEEKRLFTKVLQGFIDVFLYEFEHATGKDLDDIARKPLKSIGYNYPHSTGHGVGFAINVHEGPISISQRYKGEILPGMIFSVEPGVYLEGKFGIRIENLTLVKQRKDGIRYLENLTWVPIQIDLVDMDELSDTQKKWLLEYNKNCESNCEWYSLT